MSDRKAKIVPAEPPGLGKTGGLFGPLVDYFAHGVWLPERVRRRGIVGAWYRIARILFLASRRFVRDNCLFRASALTYITVLSLVPLLAFSFAMAKGFGLYGSLVKSTINPMLDRTFGPLPVEGVVETVVGSHEIRIAANRVLEFVEQTDVSSLGTLGLLVLLYAVIQLLGTIENSFNEIWGVQKPRSWLRKLTDYLAMVIVTPLFLITATGVTTAAQNSGIVDVISRELHLESLIEILIGLLPLFALWAGFTFLYLTMPNTRTRFSSAVIGGLIAGVLWQLTLILHLKFQIGIANYNAIYSSFAAIPIFLVWVNISWTIVLLGAEVCFAHQSEPDYLKLGEPRASDHKLKERVALSVCARIAESFRTGGEAWSSERLVDDLGIPLRPIEDVLHRLAEHCLLVVVETGPRPVYLPARDLETITVKNVLDALKGSDHLPTPPETRPVDEVVQHLLGELDAQLEHSSHNRTLRELGEIRPAARAADATPDAAPAREGDPREGRARAQRAH